MSTESKIKARQALNIAPDNKVIFSFDGGGIRGIFTIQLLKKIEEIVGAPIYDWVDMVAGTSTGAIIASLIANQKSATEIEALYEDLATKIFKDRAFGNRYTNPPQFDKINYRAICKDIFGNKSLKNLGETSGIDLFFTAKDMVAGEETFFTFFNKNESSKIVDTYQDALMRAVVEATMSAPTYFQPFERFIDGGTTVYNNPVMAALMEAFHYNGKDKYSSDNTTVFSFGTASLFRFVPLEEIAEPKGLDVLFWLDYVMDESSKDASEMQVNFLRSTLMKGLDFRRFQLSLDRESIKKLPNKSLRKLDNIDANSLHQLSNKELAKINMADVNMLPLMKVLGEAVADFVQEKNGFQSDLKGENKLVTGMDNDYREKLKKHLQKASWVDKLPTA